MIIPEIIPQDVTTVIDSLLDKKCSVLQPPASVLKLSKRQFAIPLTLLFNNSINTGKLPQLFKHAPVIPIHKKKGPKDQLGNYRPISWLSLFSKIFEKLMKKFLFNFLENNNTVNQFGFRRGLSAFDALRTFSEEIYSSLDKKHSLLSIFD